MRQPGPLPHAHTLSNRGACATSADLNKATRIGCYCKAILSAKVADMGVFDALSEMNDEELDLCGSFLADFSLTNVRAPGGGRVPARAGGFTRRGRASVRVSRFVCCCTRRGCTHRRS